MDADDRERVAASEGIRAQRDPTVYHLNDYESGPVDYTMR